MIDRTRDETGRKVTGGGWEIRGDRVAYVGPAGAECAAASPFAIDWTRAAPELRPDGSQEVVDDELVWSAPLLRQLEPAPVQLVEPTAAELVEPTAAQVP